MVHGPKSDRGKPPQRIDAGRPRHAGGPNPGPNSGHDQPYRGPAYAALDLGTNNCRLLVARPSRRGFKVIDAFSRIIRLGEGVSASGALSDAAMTRTFEALRVCAAKVSRHRVASARMVATEACRIADNAPQFLERVRRELGLDIEILSREDEAILAVAGCTSLIDLTADYALVFDIGGGSSELIWLDLALARDGAGRDQGERGAAERGGMRHAIAAWTSMPVGVVTLAERHGGKFVDARVFEDMVAFVTGLIEPFEAEHGFRARAHGRNVHLLGTSGTVTTIAGVHLGLPRYDRSRVDGCWLDTHHARAVTDRLVALDHQGRIAEPCIGRERADLVLAGCAILEALMRMWPCPRLRVADRGLREGILASLISADQRVRTRGRETAP